MVEADEIDKDCCCFCFLGTSLPLGTAEVADAVTPMTLGVGVVFGEGTILTLDTLDRALTTDEAKVDAAVGEEEITLPFNT